MTDTVTAVGAYGSDSALRQEHGSQSLSISMFADDHTLAPAEAVTAMVVNADKEMALASAGPRRWTEGGDPVYLTICGHDRSTRTADKVVPATIEDLDDRR